MAGWTDHDTELINSGIISSVQTGRLEASCLENLRSQYLSTTECQNSVADILAPLKFLGKTPADVLPLTLVGSVSPNNCRGVWDGRILSKTVAVGDILVNVSQCWTSGGICLLGMLVWGEAGKSLIREEYCILVSAKWWKIKKVWGKISFMLSWGKWAGMA